jgi:hypothetical protein
MNSNVALTESQAKLKLGLLNSRVSVLDRIETVSWLSNQGLPQEAIYEITKLWSKTRVIGGQVINIGKIIISEMLGFIRENPHLTIGLAIGASVGALVSLIPFLGPFLAPIAAVLSIAIGGIAGQRLDRGNCIEGGIVGVSQELILIAKKFFELFAGIFNALRSELA